MTAIFGCVFVCAEQHGDSLAVCNKMSNAMPDFGEKRHPLRQHGPAAFGCSLSNRLPEDRFDHQPLLVDDRYLMVADVRIDNREELIGVLYGATADSSQLADSDILMSAWKKWNLETLDRITGDFAFAVFDLVDQSLTLARDPTGQRPLFYAYGDTFAAFSSMPSGLLASSLFPNGFNLDWLASTLLDVSDLGEGTSFAHINRVKPGFVVKISANSIEHCQYWKPESVPLALSDEAFVETYNRLFNHAVTAQSRRASGALAVHLSSGFDSSAVAAFASEIGPVPPIAFTAAPRIGFDGPVPRGRIADESNLAGKTARMHRMHHVVVRSSGYPLAALRSDARIYQEPDRNIVNMDWWGEILQSARNHGATTLLTATFGNLTIHGGGLRILAQYATLRGWRVWWRQARAARRIPTVRWRGILINSFEHRLPRFAVQLLERTFRAKAKPQDTYFLHACWLRRAPALARADRNLFDSGNFHHDRLAAIASQDNGLFRIGALIEAGIDERDPTADRRLMEFGFRLPPRQMLDNGVSRPLMRRALAKRLPDAILANPARGLQAADWYEQFRKQEVLNILDEISASKTVNQLIDLERMRRTLEQWPESNWNSASALAIYRRAFTLTISIAVLIDEFEKMIDANDFTGCFPATAAMPAPIGQAATT
ncbi:MAG: hypothetical protein LH465_03325 [Sphingomonas bacterium]|nr:hypothetical protein [Sphingomonas bacterium]